jgi:hypothetical protein
VANAAQSFAQTWRIGRQVQEKAAPHRKGTIRARAGTGNNARITVLFTGSPPVTLHPPQLTPL